MNLGRVSTVKQAVKKADADALDGQEKKRTQKIGNCRRISFWQSLRNWLSLPPLYGELSILTKNRRGLIL